MDVLTVKLGEGFLKKINKAMRKFNYSTKTEFIREAIRDKLDALENRRAMKRLYAVKGTASRAVSEEELEAVREKLSRELERELSKRFK
ncbi:MAG: ribbon-helix-helix domain-containing protein [Candidatus Diapherotrites archaeon]